MQVREASLDKANSRYLVQRNLILCVRQQERRDIRDGTQSIQSQVTLVAGINFSITRLAGINMWGTTFLIIMSSISCLL